MCMGHGLSCYVQSGSGVTPVENHCYKTNKIPHNTVTYWKASLFWPYSFLLLKLLDLAEYIQQVCREVFFESFLLGFVLRFLATATRPLPVPPFIPTAFQWAPPRGFISGVFRTLWEKAGPTGVLRIRWRRRESPFVLKAIPPSWIAIPSNFIIILMTRTTAIFPTFSSRSLFPPCFLLIGYGDPSILTVLAFCKYIFNSKLGATSLVKKGRWSYRWCWIPLYILVLLLAPLALIAFPAIFGGNSPVAFTGLMFFLLLLLFGPTAGAGGWGGRRGVTGWGRGWSGGGRCGTLAFFLHPEKMAHWQVTCERQ